MADAPPHRPDRRVNGSPPPTQSKRDKRRQMLADRLASLSDKLNKDRDQVFREYLHKIQIDTTLVMRVDPYTDRPLDSFEQDQQRLHQLNGDGDSQAGPQTLLDKAGPRFSTWMETIQDFVEQRDYALTKYKVGMVLSRLDPPNRRRQLTWPFCSLTTKRRRPNFLRHMPSRWKPRIGNTEPSHRHSATA